MCKPGVHNSMRRPTIAAIRCDTREETGHNDESIGGSNASLAGWSAVVISALFVVVIAAMRA